MIYINSSCQITKVEFFSIMFCFVTKIAVILHVLYDLDHLHVDHGCRQFGLRYVLLMKSNVKTIDFNLNAFVSLKPLFLI